MPTELGTLPRTSEFPSTCVLPPSLPCPPFPPISKSHISPARSFTLFTSLNNYPLVFFRGLALPGRSRIPIYSFRDPAFFPFSSGGTYKSTRAPCPQPPSIPSTRSSHILSASCFRLDVYYHATSNTHGTQIDRSCDFQGPPATAGVSRALILPPFPQLKEAAELQPIHHHV